MVSAWVGGRRLACFQFIRVIGMYEDGIRVEVL